MSTTTVATIVLPILDATTLVDPGVFVNQKSLFFDGNDEYLNFGTDADIQFDADSSFSISFWFSCLDVTTTSHIIGNRPPGGAGWRVIKDVNLTTTGNFTFQFFGATSSQAIVVRGGGDLFDGAWRHFAATYDGSTDATGVSLYINGTLASSTISTNALPSGAGTQTSALTAGGASSLSQFYNGFLDEMFISNTALSAAQVSDVYNAGVPKRFKDVSGVIHGWRNGDDDSYPTIADIINSLNATMVNMEPEDIVSNVP